MHKADRLSREGKYDEAIALYNKVDEEIEYDRRDYDVYDGLAVNRGITYYLKGNYDKAIDDFTFAIRRQEIGRNYYLRGDAYEKKGKRDNAIADYKEAANRGHEDALKRLAKMGIQYIVPHDELRIKKLEEKIALTKRLIRSDYLYEYGSARENEIRSKKRYEKELPILKKELRELKKKSPTNQSNINKPTSSLFDWIKRKKKSLIWILVLGCIFGYLMTGPKFDFSKEKAPLVETKLVVTANTLNLREKDTNQSPVIKKLKKGDVITYPAEYVPHVYNEVNVDVWIRVESEGVKGWVNEKYVSVYKEEKESEKVVLQTATTQADADNVEAKELEEVVDTQTATETETEQPAEPKEIPAWQTDIIGKWKGPSGRATFEMTVNDDMTGVFWFENNGMTGSYKMMIKHSDGDYQVIGTEWIEQSISNPNAYGFFNIRAKIIDGVFDGYSNGAITKLKKQ